jgi:flagellar protein FliT
VVYQNTIEVYEAIAELSDQMLVAATQEDWDKLIELEISCAQYVEDLKFYNNVLPLSSDARQRKEAAIKRILADDAEIRKLVAPSMEKLTKLINSTQNGKKLANAYEQ